MAGREQQEIHLFWGAFLQRPVLVSMMSANLRCFFLIRNKTALDFLDLPWDFFRFKKEKAMGNSTPLSQFLRGEVGRMQGHQGSVVPSFPSQVLSHRPHQGQPSPAGTPVSPGAELTNADSTRRQVFPTAGHLQWLATYPAFFPKHTVCRHRELRRRTSLRIRSTAEWS